MQGLLLVDKPQGITSFDVVRKIKRLTNEKRVGHTGTLDPMATGVLPVLIGRATLLCDYLLTAAKEYIATVKLGIQTDTLDITGNVTCESQVNVTQEALNSVLLSFLGHQSQIPPMYSAISKDGVKMYSLARQGISIELEPREIDIYELELVGPLENNEFSIRVLCSKGTYIRSLCRDIGEKLGCGAVMTALRRTKTAGFTEADTVKLDDLNENNISQNILPEGQAVSYMKKVSVSQLQAARFSAGGGLDIKRLKTKTLIDNDNAAVYFDEQFLGVGKVKKGELKPNCLINQYELPISQRPKVAVCLGTFDGLHKGHLSVLNNGLNSKMNAVALAFSYPPANSAAAIMQQGEKLAALKGLGFKKVVFLDYKNFKDMSAGDFEEYLVNRFNIGKICCGYDYTYGAGRMGNPESMAKFCNQRGIELSVADPVCVDNIPLSSTLIREYLRNGEIEKANSLLYKPFGFSSEVIEGDKRGRTFGFPTVNQLYPEGLVQVKHGVYFVEVEIDGKKYNGIANIGVRPTYKTERCMSETYIKDFSGDLYGKSLKISLLRFLREERKFASADQLIAQIKEDIISVFG